MKAPLYIFLRLALVIFLLIFHRNLFAHSVKPTDTLATSSITHTEVSASENPQNENINTLKNLTLEQLASVNIVSAAKVAQKASNTAAAIYVITQEDIQRSGLNSIPEILRLAPGVNVAQIDANKWAINIRGFNGRFADNLLVLIDGRSVYTPLFSGTFWDVQDLPLDNIERIEVIRGPGGAIWGANATNGVINIITKSAKDTQAKYVKVGTGNKEKRFATLQYGSHYGAHTFYRGYIKYFNNDTFERVSGGAATDEFEMTRGGFRVDWENNNDELTLDGTIYDGRPDDTSLTSASKLSWDVSGGSLQASWIHHISETSNLAIKSYYARETRESRLFAEDRDTVDVNFYHNFTLLKRNAIVWGADFRVTNDDITNASNFGFLPDSRRDELISAFIHDDISIINDYLHFIVGGKFERNDYTGSEFQPNARLLFTPDDKQQIWLAYSRAVTTPNRTTDNIYIINSTNTLRGNQRLRSEILYAHELGYRLQATEQLTLDIATFYNRYERLFSFELQSITPGVPPVANFALGNELKAETYGTEVAANAQITRAWQIKAAYSWLKLNLHRTQASRDTRANEMRIEQESPEQQFNIRSHWDLSHHVSMDSALYYVDSLGANNIPSYTRVDVGLSWQPYPELTTRLGIRNLLDRHHPEFASTLEGPIATAPTEISRTFYAQIVWRA
ncbi:MAG: TonB-dependent receptor plug domain-containing protein [Gammaproteobacteria bacterium]